MFERLTERAGNAAERHARVRAEALAEAMQAELPPGIKARAVSGGVEVSGRAARRRFALEPALRWLIAGLR